MQMNNHSQADSDETVIELEYSPAPHNSLKISRRYKIFMVTFMWLFGILAFGAAAIPLAYFKLWGRLVHGFPYAVYYRVQDAMRFYFATIAIVVLVALYNRARRSPFYLAMLLWFYVVQCFVWEWICLRLYSSMTSSHHALGIVWKLLKMTSMPNLILCCVFMIFSLYLLRSKKAKSVFDC